MLKNDIWIDLYTNLSISTYDYVKKLGHCLSNWKQNTYAGIEPYHGQYEETSALTLRKAQIIPSHVSD
jgi:hypothetical protein